MPEAGCTMLKLLIFTVVLITGAKADMHAVAFAILFYFDRRNFFSIGLSGRLLQVKMRKLGLFVFPRAFRLLADVEVTYKILHAQ